MTFPTNPWLGSSQIQNSLTSPATMFTNGNPYLFSGGNSIFGGNPDVLGSTFSILNGVDQQMGYLNYQMQMSAYGFGGIQNNTGGLGGLLGLLSSGGSDLIDLLKQALGIQTEDSDDDSDSDDDNDDNKSVMDATKALGIIKAKFGTVDNASDPNSAKDSVIAMCDLDAIISNSTDSELVEAAKYLKNNTALYSTLDNASDTNSAKDNLIGLCDIDAYLAKNNNSTPSTNDQKLTQIVTKLYEDILGREPDAGGLQNYINHLKNGDMTVQQIEVEMQNSAEFKRVCAGGNGNSDAGEGKGLDSSTTLKNIVTRLYEDVLGREPDAGGLVNYINHLKNGDMTIEQIRDEMESSAEFNRVRTGGRGNSDAGEAQGLDSNTILANIVKRAYEDILGREPDTGGLVNYVNHLKEGWTIEQIRTEMASSAEFKGIEQG